MTPAAAAARQAHPDPFVAQLRSSDIEDCALRRAPVATAAARQRVHDLAATRLDDLVAFREALARRE